jgi:hypothetical protein
MGHATVETPLLDQPLAGNVYLRSSSHELPDLVVDLRGQIHIELAGRIDRPKGRGLRTTFTSLPDAPVSSFVLELAGGKRGLLVNSASLCKARQTAALELDGQNGKRVNRSTKLQTGCGGAKRHKRHRRAHRRHLYQPGEVR